MALIDMSEIFQMTNVGDHIDGTDVYQSNDNLLDNAYFLGGGSQLGDGVFPINQRGQTSYSGASNTIDRWKTENSSISVGADGLTWTATGDNGQFEQIIENYKLIEGETYTATIDCDISAGSARLFVGGVSSPWPTVAGSAVNVSSGITKVTFTFARESGYTGQYKLALASVGSCTAKLRKFKLEKGTVSTLSNDPPPDFGEELAKCQRYLWVKTFTGNTQLGSGIALTADQAVVSVITPTPMRSAQNITFTANCLLVGNGQVLTVSAVTGINQYDNIARLVLSSSGLTAYHTYSFLTTTETTMAIYAEL